MCRKLLVLVVFGAGLHGAGDGPLDRATLRGIQAVTVVVDPVDAVVEEEGATRAELAARLENRLRAASISIDAASREFVALRLTTVRVARGPFAVAMSIAVYQPVELARDPKIRTATGTWEVDTVLLAPPKVLYGACQDALDDLASRFIAAFRSANAPKP